LAAGKGCSYGVAMVDVTVGAVAGGWEARTGAEPIGRLGYWIRADQRCYLHFKDCRADAYGPLLAQAAAELDRDLYLNADEAHRAQLAALGFVVGRRELLYRIPTDPARSRVAMLGPPAGVDLVSAADVDLDRLRVLDDALRQDIPGCDGWRWDPEEFREDLLGRVRSRYLPGRRRAPDGQLRRAHTGMDEGGRPAAGLSRRAAAVSAYQGYVGAARCGDRRGARPWLRQPVDRHRGYQPRRERAGGAVRRGPGWSLL
jgi:hypothetical protein